MISLHRAASTSVLLLACLLSVQANLPVDDSTLTQVLAMRTAASKDKVLSFSSDDWDKYGLAPGRSYHIVVFMASTAMWDSPKTQLRQLRVEFGLMADAFARGPDSKRVFFAEILFEKNQALFNAMKVSQLPLIFRWGPNMAPKASGMYDISDDLKAGKGIPKYPWPAEALSKWVEVSCNAAYAPVDRPSFVKSPFFPVVLFCAALALGLAGYLVLTSELVRKPALWLLGSLVVYWFSVSGGMFNIIRGMPMYVTRQDGTVQFWTEGRSHQLGFEGFFMGSVYLLASASLALLVYFVPTIKDSQHRKLLSVAALLTFAATVRTAFWWYTWKASYSLNLYFFRR